MGLILNTTPSNSMTIVTKEFDETLIEGFFELDIVAKNLCFLLSFEVEDGKLQTCSSTVDMTEERLLNSYYGATGKRLNRSTLSNALNDLVDAGLCSVSPLPDRVVVTRNRKQASDDVAEDVEPKEVKPAKKRKSSRQESPA